jgi:hypothetical protein
MNETTKKNLMFISSEDFYLLSYSIIIILDSLGCVKNRYFKDYRKLSFIIEIIKNRRHILTIENGTKTKLHINDKDFLFQSYANGLARRSETLKILFSLEKKGYIALEQGKIDSFVNAKLLKENLPSNFLDKEIFNYEYENCNRLKTSIKKISMLNLETFLDKIYRDNGVKIWEI